MSASRLAPRCSLTPAGCYGPHARHSPEEEGPPPRGRLLGLHKFDPASHLGLTLLFQLLSQRPAEQVRQSDARTLQPIPHKGDVLFEIRHIDDDYLLVLGVSFPC